MENPSIVQCPVCNKFFPSQKINVHVNSCLGDQDEIIVNEDQTDKNTSKRKSSDNGEGWAFMMNGNRRTKKSRTSLADTENGDTVIIDDSEEINPPDTNETVPKLDQSASNNNSKESVLKSHTSASNSKHTTSSANDTTHTVGLGELTVPLAEFMRPKTLDAYLGQEKAVGSNSMLGSLLHLKQIPSIIIWGPPGCGKTTLAKIISEQCKKKVMFKKLSAVHSGVKDVNEAVKQAKNDRKMFHKGTILFIDEIHRFNKLQQDSLLPHVEDGTIILIGATTENPSFQVNNALLSRCKVIVLEKLDSDATLKILINAVEKLGYHVYNEDNELTCDRASFESSSTKPTVLIEKPALEFLAQICDGDARIALNGLQMAVQSHLPSNSQSDVGSHRKESRSSGNKTINVTLEHVKKSLQKSHIAYDKTGEEHYNILSAFHKSIRGSADSAALYWLARMLEGGESPITIARRLVACATEDIGIADPQALVISISAFQTVQFLGMPECEKALAECTVYLARAPKSIEVYQAYNKAKAAVWEHEGPLPGVPLHLRNASTKLMKNLGYGKGYTYYGKDQEYFPVSMKGTNFFAQYQTEKCKTGPNSKMKQTAISSE